MTRERIEVLGGGTYSPTGGRPKKTADQVALDMLESKFHALEAKTAREEVKRLAYHKELRALRKKARRESKVLSLHTAHSCHH